MTAALAFQTFTLWMKKAVGVPPQRAEFILSFSEVSKALLSFTFDMRATGSRLDPAQAILINDKPVTNLDLPLNDKSKSLEFIERQDIDITKLVKTSPQGIKNLVEVNYLLSRSAILKTRIPNTTVGELTLEIKVFFPTTTQVSGPAPPPLYKFCMNCGKSIPRESKVCPYCTLPPPPGGTNPKKCTNCADHYLPPQALFCDECGTKQPAAQAGMKTCINPSCQKTIPDDAAFCSYCGRGQTKPVEVKAETIPCPHCGNIIPPDARFCNKCGAERPSVG